MAHPRQKPRHPALTSKPAVDVFGSLEHLQVDYLRSRDPNSYELHAKPPRLGELEAHTLFLGTNGSGKSTAMKLHMRSVLPAQPVRNEAGVLRSSPYSTNFRALVYDPKTDLVPFLSSLGFTHDEHIINTNIFDRRCAAWDVAADVDTYKMSQVLADIMVRPPEGKDPFWQLGVQHIVAAAIDGLNVHSPRSWGMHELTEVLLEEEHLRVVLDRTSAGRQAAKRYLAVGEGGPGVGVRNSILASLIQNVEPHRAAARAWMDAKYSFSFREWARGGGILLLGDDYVAERQAMHVNNMLIRFAISSVLGIEGDIRHATTFCYLDELKRAGRFPGFGTLLTQGRSKGLRCILAAQGYTTFKAAFEEKEVGEILNNVGEKCVMTLTEPEDTEWAERLFATVERQKVSRTHSEDGQQADSRTYSTAWEPTVRAGDFMKLETAKQSGRALDAYVISTGSPPEHPRYSAEWVRNHLAPLPGAVPAEASIARRHGDAFRPVPLELSDLVRLGIVGGRPSSPEADPEPQKPEAPSMPRTRFRLPPAPERHA